ncbi:class III lanthionine synthetase LanKC [Actinoplanes sp. NPDC051494]|uniref:class III lanthionine synthetase LanKC n=1 Tax=Actinoplanes sp. NPDC051494 TaxID=3363907 RepID=UPI003791DE73
MTRSSDEYCQPGGVFFDRPSGASAGFAPLPLPPGRWTVRDANGWRMAWPADADLPEQGWKLHVSATPDAAAGTLEIVAAFCAGREIPFKHLPSPRAVLLRNSKYAGRGGSGKFVTVYPRDDDEFALAAEELARLLRGRPGPYILSDRRIGAGPVHARYGGFRRLTTLAAGREVPAIRRPDGVLVPDPRPPVFRPPEWVTLPAVLGNPPPDTGLPYRVTAALHFSNGGGVYRAERDGRTVVLKEARPHAGLDSAGHDAVHRLRCEHEALSALAGIPGIPEVYDLLPAWEHTFLAMQHVPGVPLGRWTARNIPLHGGDMAGYRHRAMALADRLDTLIAAVHDRGWVVGDLHPHNVLVDADDTLHLIDFECAAPIGSTIPATLGAPGFRAPPGTYGVDLDLHALAAIRLSLLVPLTPLLELAPEKLGTHLRYAGDDFPATAARRLCAGWQPRRPEPGWPGTDPVAALVRALHASATPERPDRLFPGDVEQFRSGGTGFGHGAAGVLYALTEAGEPLDPAYERWLLAADLPAAPGFWTGAHGVAYVLDRLGHHDRADGLLDRHRPPERPDLEAGLAGIGLTLLDIATRRRTVEFVDRAAALAERILTGPAAELPAELPAGLLTGWSGPALLCLRLYEHTGEQRWLGAAERLLDRDLARCPPDADGMRQYRDGVRLLPYLGTGSAGVAVVATELARHLPESAPARALPELLRSCRPNFTVYPGLMQGRAGLLLLTPELSPGVLDLHAVGCGDGVAFPGTGLTRLSMDVHTGTAGVLLALTGSGLPFFAPPPAPGRPAGLNRKGTPSWTAFSNSRTS